MLSRAIRAGVAALAVLTTLPGAVACGAPEFTYVKNSDEKTYFRVPHGWHPIKERDLDDVVISAPTQSVTAELIRRRSWNAGYDADAYPTVGHLFSFAVTTNQPFVYAQVLQLDKQEQNVSSMTTMRNFFLPVTPEEYRKPAAEELGLGFYELVHDELLTPSDNLHGVRVVYNYVLPSRVLHTFDLTVLTNNANNRIYALLIRCSTRCYRDRFDELNSIATSFTVRNRS